MPVHGLLVRTLRVTIATALTLAGVACSSQEPATTPPSTTSVTTPTSEITPTPTGNPAGAKKSIHPTTAPVATIAKGKTKKTDGVDSCSLLRPADLAFLGGTSDTAPIRDEVIPDSCGYRLSGGGERDQAVVALHEPLDQTRGRQPVGEQFDTNGYATWLTCDPEAGTLTCTAALAVRKDATLVMILSKKDTPKEKLIDALHQLTLQALRRLPDDPTG